jgi:hypothetical protein
MQNVGMHADLDAQRQAVTGAKGGERCRQLLESRVFGKIELDLVGGIGRPYSALSVLECGHCGDPLQLLPGVACLVMIERGLVEEWSATIRQIG